MSAEHIAVLALLQGLTEFLPISSSAHLILVPKLLGWPDQGLAFDVAVHVGTLVAVVTYFRAEVAKLSHDWLCSLRARSTVGESVLAWGVVAGTVPVAVAGLLLGDAIEASLRSPLVIASATIGFGLALLWADRTGVQARSEHRLALRDCLVIGVAQALALIPGTSRSGITITAGLALGLTATGAARFSFLLSIPVIVLAAGAKSLELIQQAGPVDWRSLALGAGLSALSAYACIHFFLRLLTRIGLLPFLVYRFGLGAFVLIVYL